MFSIPTGGLSPGQIDNHSGVLRRVTNRGLTMNLNDYDHIIVYFSGGKDSLACLLHLLELGVDKNKIELWHHDVDGREGGKMKMDWPVTADYCRAVAAALDIPVYFSWRMGGFEREMLRENARTAPTRFETPGGEIGQAGGIRGKLNTRRKFPQVSANLTVRWCSAYLKIDVATIALNNQARFHDKKVLTISGERAEESVARSKYKKFEPDRADRRDGRAGRHIDRWRPVLHWPEQKVWDIIERHKINPHPAYHLGWGRVSCMTCIFGSHNQWSSVAEITPQDIETIADYEQEFGLTIHRSLSVPERINMGQAYPMNGYVDIALSENYTELIIVEDWQLPAGAFGESCGPT